MACIPRVSNPVEMDKVELRVSEDFSSPPHRQPFDLTPICVVPVDRERDLGAALNIRDFLGLGKRADVLSNNDPP